MKSTQQLVGQRFGHGVVLECAGKDKGRNVCWRLKCDCGTIYVARGSALLAGTTRSCGCLVHTSEAKKEASRRTGHLNKTHGLSRTPTWVSWSMMMQRCFNPKRKDFAEWGGRGIKPCLHIAKSPENVIAMIGERPADLQIDRINNDGGYTCGQCDECRQHGWPLNIKWSNRVQQGRNRRDNVRFTYQGLTMTRQEFADHYGKSIGWVRYHIG